MKINRNCSFCGKHEDEVGFLGRKGDSDLTICKGCVLSYFHIMELTHHDVAESRYRGKKDIKKSDISFPGKYCVVNKGKND